MKINLGKHNYFMHTIVEIKKFCRNKDLLEYLVILGTDINK